MFVDEAIIDVRAGDGGRGSVSFRREKHVPRGGPDGGNGGRGGSVILVADDRLTTLLDFHYQRHYRADAGAAGSRSNKSGSDGGDLQIHVPIGTIIMDVESGEVLVDFAVAGQEAVAARGGMGGRGNASFTSSTHQTPRFAEKGEPGQSRQLKLELKLLADVGIVGMPNAGKSTLIARISAARPKIADYPFTTLTPNLGVVSPEPGRSFVVADVPGLVEGASEGRGLGHQFLRHVERTRLLVHVLDCSGMSGRDPVDDFRVVNAELAAHSERLRGLEQIVALNKSDLPTSRAAIDAARAALEGEGGAAYPISAVTGAGVQSLVFAMATKLDELGPAALAIGEPTEAITRFHAKPAREWQVARAGEGEFVVSGTRVERMVAMTDLRNEPAVRRLQRIFERMGVVRRLRELGAEEGDTVRVGAEEFDFVE